MKKVILFSLLSVFSFLSIHAQRINDDGKKVVSHVDIEYFGGSYYGTIDFKYNEKLKLQSFEFKQECPNDKYFESVGVLMVKKGNKLIRKDYECGKVSKNWSHEYMLDDMGHIVKRMRYDYAIDDSYTLLLCNEIEYGSMSKELYSVTTSLYRKDRNENEFSKVSDDFISDVRYFPIKEDGNMYYKRKQVAKYGESWSKDNPKQFVYTNIVNDLNINLSHFYFQYGHERKEDEVDYLTEWYNIECKNMLHTTIFGANTITEYDFDKNGNISVVRIYKQGYNKKTIMYKLTIEYLH